MTDRCCIAASSQIISTTHRSMIACFEFLLMLHSESSQRLSTEMENVECAVQPPGRRRAEMLDDATQSTMCPSAWMQWHKVLYTNVFPVPAGPLRKNVCPD